MALIEMVLEAQGYIPGPPSGQESLWSIATRNDTVTVNSWHDIWINQTKENAKTHDFSEHSVMAEHGKCAYRPVIVAGSGPSLKKNWKQLIGDGPEAKSYGRRDLRIVSASHNFPFFEDRDVMTQDDYYVTLDAGEIAITELSEGGQHEPEWYWNRSKDRTLIAYNGTHPDFIRKWQGKILWYTTPYASEELGQALGKLVNFGKVPAFNIGGNVLGACLYMAKAVLGCSIPIFIGADFSFGYDRKFHAWDSHYDKKFAGVQPCTDIFGNRVWTWPSYYGFKCWFDYMATGGQGKNAQIWVNATEGGIMGAYPEGNIQQIIQLDLRTALHMFGSFNLMPELMAKSAGGLMHILY